MPTFVDRVVLHLAAGNGGHGCTSIHREKFKPLGGPDGGTGGRGGDIILAVDPSTTTLLDFHFHPHQKATSGRPGQGSNRDGAEGADLILPVPIGTVVTGADGVELADMIGADARFVVAHGGRGGRGNAALANARRKAPGFSELGEPGEETDVVLELKTVADVGLVGFPSAGKSSLVSVVSAARPKIADYPFTTLAPNLGVVKVGDLPPYTVADVPGLIPGASDGKGLGLQFLRHVERCAVLVHVIDCATLEPDRDPLSDLDALEQELAAYSTELANRPRLVVLNKIDVPEARELAELVRPDLEARGLRVFEISAVTHEGVRALMLAMGDLVAGYRASLPPAEPERIVLRPRPVRDVAFDVRREDDGYVVTGATPERWVRQTNFDNSEAVGYLADRLARLGVEAALAQLGAEPGEPVTIGGMTFDWEPTLSDKVNLGPRGADDRLADSVRLSRAERDGRYDSRRVEQHGEADLPVGVAAGPVELPPTWAPEPDRGDPER